MDIIPPGVVARVIFVLGLVNVITGLSIFLSCRCIPGSKIGTRLMKYSAYKRFFKYHCYIWWPFWTSVVVHVIFAFMFIGFPF
jgi:hypothetical protein